MSLFYRISGIVNFPEGLAAGEGRESNVTAVAQDGMGRYVLRGTSIAGTIRSALPEWGVPETSVAFWFGDRKEEKNDFKASQIMVSDMVLDTGKQSAENRMHNMLNRHTGTVLDGALPEVQMLPPGTTGRLLVYVMPRDGQPAENILQSLKNVFANTMLVGGSKNRGIGRMDACQLECHSFDTSSAEGFALWQDVRYADRQGTGVDLSSCQRVEFASSETLYSLSLDVDLKIPQGEDIAVGYGKDVEGNLCAQQYVYDAKGVKLWRIPGSTFRGVFRSWMTRLAVLDGENVLYQDKNPKAHLVGSAGLTGEEYAAALKNPDKLGDPILDLFGSLYRCGRIHFSDAFCESSEEVYEQVRSHVAIDRFSGGSNPSALFHNKVLVGPGVFKLKISILKPNAKELEWLKKTLFALHLGIISVGSSKASGLLEINNWDCLKSDLENAIKTVKG